MKSSARGSEREKLIEQVKGKDDMIALLQNSYSMKIGKTILFPFKYIRRCFFRVR